jgi:Mrp family chromosome partitioning ATPase
MLSHWGQLYPRPDRQRKEPSADIITTAPASAVTHEIEGKFANTETASAPKTPTAAEPNIVLNVAGTPTQETREWREEVQALLREVSGSGAIVILRVEAGSLYVFVADPSNALASTGLTNLRQAFQQHLNTKLVGMASVEDFDWSGRIAGELKKASTDLLSWPKTLPDGQWLERPEFSVLKEKVEGTDRSASVLLGAPGSGKSALLAALAHHYVDLGWPVLAIKADALDPDIANEADLQARLGLSAPPSEVIKRIARVRPVLFVIDQLDALAG